MGKNSILNSWLTDWTYRNWKKKHSGTFLVYDIEIQEGNHAPSVRPTEIKVYPYEDWDGSNWCDIFVGDRWIKRNIPTDVLVAAMVEKLAGDISVPPF